MNKQLLITGALALVVGAGLGYFGSSAFAKAPTNGLYIRSGFTASSTAFARGGNQAFGSALSGTVAAKDSGSITLNTRDGSSHVILVTPDTTVSKIVTGSLSDVTMGASIVVTGTTNSDGSVSASSIELRPAMSSATVGS
ncbi:MAG: hypothetical protein ACREGR_05240 [Minisyncoccia bacterium]